MSLPTVTNIKMVNFATSAFNNTSSPTNGKSIFSMNEMTIRNV